MTTSNTVGRLMAWCHWVNVDKQRDQDTKLMAEDIDKVLKVAVAANEMLNDINPMFCDTDEGLVKLRDAMKDLDASSDEVMDRVNELRDEWK